MGIEKRDCRIVTVPFVDLVSQYHAIREEVDEAIASVLERAAFIGGSEVESFEHEFAAYQEASYCVAVANGTDALEVAFEALDVPAGAEVIVPANSFVASSEAVGRAGLRVVFADVNGADYTLDVDDVSARITDRTRVILPVHLYGQPARLDELRALAAKHDLILVEDAAQAHGARFAGRRVGAIGRVGTFSFYPAKNLGAYGDAGAILTDDEALAKRMRMIANHGRVAKYDHEFEGRNSRLDALQAAVLRVKLRHLDAWTAQRRALANRYRMGLAEVGDLRLPAEISETFPVYHLFVVRTDRRDQLREALGSDGVQTGIHYPVALPRLGAYEDHPQHLEPFRAARYAEQSLSLPMAESITVDQVDRVIEAVRSFFGD